MGRWLPFLVLIGSLAEATPFPNNMSWRKGIIEVRFQAALSKELENPTNANPPDPSIGTFKDREATMVMVIAEWNNALANAGSNVRLKLVKPTKRFAADQAQPVCTDFDSGDPVYQPGYARWNGDGTNVGSTGEDTLSARRNLGPGWVVGDSPVSETIDGRLAETALIPKPNDLTQNQIREADILWFTHLNQGKRCPRLRWNYVTPNAPAPAPYYDYYSVMLHEVGHLLGLDHESCPMPPKAPPNVMQPRLNAGDRFVISPCELKTLRALYGPGAAGNVPMPAKE